MGFKATVEDVDIFVKILRAVQAVTDEPCFNVTYDGLDTASMDPIHISLVKLHLDRQFFVDYEVDEDTSLTVNVTSFISVLKRARKYDALTIMYDDAEKKMSLTLTDRGGNVEKNIVLHALETTKAAPATPRVGFTAFARLYTDALAEAIEDCKIVDDRVRIVITPGELVLTSRGDLGDVKHTLRKGVVYEADSDGETYATFSISYLEKIVDAVRPLTRETVLRLSTNKPVKVEPQIQPNVLEFFVAPIIE